MDQIIVVGGNFAGLTSALEVKRRLGNAYRVVLISKLPFFLFTPSLIWLPSGRRNLEDIILPLEPLAAKAQVEFVHAEATQVLPKKRIVKCGDKEFNYDYLILATGPEWIFDQIDGMRLDGNMSFIVTPDAARAARNRWLKFAENPGPVVIGAMPGVQLVAQAYEVLFNVEKSCRDLGIRKKVELTFVTPEPFLGHLGMEGVTGSRHIFQNLLTKLGIRFIVNATVEKVASDSIHLANGDSFPYSFSIFTPRFKGPSLIGRSAGLGIKDDFLPVNDGYQHIHYPNIFGVGAVAATPLDPGTPPAVALPKNGYAASMSAKTAAHNIVHLITGRGRFRLTPFTRLPELTVLDAANREILGFSSTLLKPRSFSLMLENPVCDLGKLMVEKYFLWKIKQGYSRLP
ncbi:MAG TPA: FAD-dependent oxidoreductase [Selenomonadales bacterium]|nr:FAD-dependent oxidoreductase [Selenomonadales bacterium]